MRILGVAVALFLLAGCSATPTPAAPEAAPTQPSTTESLAEFCGDLDVVDASLVVFSADITKFIVPGGGPADVSEATRLAGVVVEEGTALLPEAPEDIKTELSTVIAATQEAVGHLATADSAGLLAASEVMFRDDVVAAREAVSAYPPCG
jgi:hypothetical protein